MKYTYEIKQDELAENPRDEFDTLSVFYGLSGHYLIGGKNDVELRYRDSLEDEIKDLRKEGAVIVEFSSNNGPCYAIVTVSKLKDEYLKHGYSMRKAKYWARRCAQEEIEEFLAWGNGEVYGYEVTDDDGEVVDSCWGFYGESGRKEAESEAKSFIEWKMKDDQEQEVLINACLAI